MTPHTLHDEFPHDTAILHELKLTNGHYQTLARRYEEINGEIHRIEAGTAPATPAHSEDLKKQRLHLLDEISVMIQRAKVG